MSLRTFCTVSCGQPPERAVLLHLRSMSFESCESAGTTSGFAWRVRRYSPMTRRGSAAVCPSALRSSACAT